MKWILQNNLHSEYGYNNFIKSLNKKNADILYVKPIPFTDIILPENFDSNHFNGFITKEQSLSFNNNESIIVFGSNILSRIAKKNNWYPGTFLNDNFSYQNWLTGFGKENLLNDEVIITKIINCPILEKDTIYFSRPTEDNKAFSGITMTGESLNLWFKDISHIEEESYLPLHKNTEIIISKYKKIISECRFFIVDGKVITGSMYKYGNNVIHDANFEVEFLNFSQQMVDKWQPAKAFVLDIAKTEDGFKVIEVNNFNSSGFYKSDTDLIVASLIKTFG